MAVNVKLIHCGDINSPEVEESLVLKRKFDNYFKNTSAKGDIFILTNNLLYGHTNNELDLVIIGSLSGFETSILSKFKNDSGIEFPAKDISVEIKSFCLIIELKEHDIRNIITEDINSKGLIVRYISTNTIENVSSQSRGQMITLMKTLKEKFGEAPAIANLIYLKNVASAHEIGNVMQNNILYKDFSIKDLWETATQVTAKFMPVIISSGPNNVVNCELSADTNKSAKAISNYIELLSQKPVIHSEITRKRIEMMNTDILSVKLQDLNYDKGILIFKGKAGTGKTSALLRIAYLLKEEKNARVKILSYNRALVGDMKRTFAFFPIERRPDGKAMSVSTMQHFFIEIMNLFGIESIPTFEKGFQKKYEKSMIELDNLLSSKEDVDFLKMERPLDLAWDYVLVDEAQDWSDQEKNVLLKLYGDGHVIVADGGCQIVRDGFLPQNWTIGVDKDRLQIKKYNEGLRQSANLNRFVNQYANLREASWSINLPPKYMPGGRIQIYLTDEYLDEIATHLQRYKNELKSSKNELYDLLMFVPSDYVFESHLSNISLIKGLKEAKIPYFEGVNPSERSDYPLEQMRIYQYESCRGLEGWITVCLDFDRFIKNKIDRFNDVPNPEVMNTKEERIKEFIDSWIMMAITRPISDLVITISDLKSETAQEMIKLYERCPDIVELHFM